MSFLFPHSSKRAGSVQLSSKEQWLYDELWKQANSQGAAVVSSVPAVEFLNKSGISPFSLAAVWQITALNERGQDYFDRDAFNAALRLIGHVQAGKAPSAALLSVEAPLPNFNLINPKYTAAAATAEASTSPRNMTSGIPAMAWPPMPASEMKSYRELFRSLDKENGLLRGEIVLQIVNKSQLPTGTLAKILALVDRNSRAALDEDEFVMAMYLVMCLKKNAIVALPPALPAEVMEICSVKAGGGANTGRQTSPLPNDANNNIYSALGLDYNSTTERERQLLAMLQTQQQQREKVQEAYLAQMLENSRVAEERLYKQQMEQNKTMKDQIAPMIAQYQLQRMQAAQQELAPLMSSTALGSGRYADIFAEGYNNAMKQQQELFERMSAANQPLGTAAPPTPSQTPADNPPAYSVQQPGVFSPALSSLQPGSSLPPHIFHQPSVSSTVPAYQQPSVSSPVPPYQQPGVSSPVTTYQQQQQPQYPQYQQQPYQAYSPQQQQQQPYQSFGYPMPPYSQSQQYNPYTQYTQSGPASPVQAGVASVPGYQSYQPPPQGNPQYQQFAPGQPQQPLSPGNPQQTPIPSGNPQQQPMSPGNPQYPPNHEQQQHLHQQQPMTPGHPQQYLPPRQPQMYPEQQAAAQNVPLPPTPTSPTTGSTVGPPLPLRAPQDRNDYSTTTAITTTTASLVGPPLPLRAPQDRNDYSATMARTNPVPPPLPRRPGQQPGRQQEGPVRAPQYREPISWERG